MIFTRGNRARFVATFKVGPKIADPAGGVIAIVRTPSGGKVFTSGELEHVDVGVYAIELVLVESGKLTVKFEAHTGEFSETSYDILEAQATEPAAEATTSTVEPRRDAEAERLARKEAEIRDDMERKARRSRGKPGP